MAVTSGKCNTNGDIGIKIFSINSSTYHPVKKISSFHMYMSSSMYRKYSVSTSEEMKNSSKQ